MSSIDPVAPHDGASDTNSNVVAAADSDNNFTTINMGLARRQERMENFKELRNLEIFTADKHWQPRWLHD